MKSPDDVRRILTRQWQSADTRVHRLLGGRDAWPVNFSIGLPSADDVLSNLDQVKRHINLWRRVSVGEVLWSQRAYRATAEAISVPTHWRLHRPSQWIAACDDRSTTEEFERLSAIIGNADPIYHEVLARRRSLWRDKPDEEVILAASIASELQPGIADGRPLRTISLHGTDTKFFERNEGLVTTLLDVRFDGEPSRLGLAAFLDALSESEHWILLLDLDGNLLPFERMRVRTTELQSAMLPSGILLIIENETCSHLLPTISGTIAVLGSGFDLSWMSADWLAEKRIAYWGDLDTWGLSFLANARRHQPHLVPLLMDVETLTAHAAAAVPEPVAASDEPPVGLTSLEQDLYRRLQTSSRGRLEQEFLPLEIVCNAINNFVEGPGRNV